MQIKLECKKSIYSPLTDFVYLWVVYSNFIIYAVVCTATNSVQVLW